MQKRRRSISTPVVVIGCALVAALLVGIGLVAFDVGANDDGEATSSDLAASEETASTSTEARLTAESRLGYAGLGPLQLGMSEAEAARAAGATFVPTDGGCSWRVDPEGDFGGGLSAYFVDGLAQISVTNPAIRTISGIRVGSSADDIRRTSSNAVPGAGAADYSELAITNPEGRHIRFFMDSAGVVVIMELTLSSELSEGIARC